MVTVQLKASDADLLQIAKFLVKQNKITREDIKDFASASRYKAKVNGQVVSYSYSDVYYIICGLQASGGSAGRRLVRGERRKDGREAPIPQAEGYRERLRMWRW